MKLSELYSQIKSSLEEELSVSVITLMNPNNKKDSAKLLIDSNEKVSGDIDIPIDIANILKKHVYKKMNTHAFATIFSLFRTFL